MAEIMPDGLLVARRMFSASLGHTEVESLPVSVSAVRLAVLLVSLDLPGRTLDAVHPRFWHDFCIQ